MINGFNTSENFLENYLNQKEYLYVTCVTYEFFEMTYNWFLHLKKLNLENNVLVVAFDSICYTELQKFNIPSVLFETEMNTSNIEDISSVIPRINCVGYIAEKYKIDIIYSEVDVIILKDPLEILKKEIEGYDLAVASNKPYRSSLPIGNFNSYNDVVDNLGFLGFCYGLYETNKKFVNVLNSNVNNDKNEPLYNLFLPKSLNSLYDTFTNIYANLNIKYKTLNAIQFANGSCLSKSILKEKILENAVTLHYNNCANSMNLLEKRDIKIQLMKENNHWLV